MPQYPTKAEVLAPDGIQPTEEQLAKLKEWRECFPKGHVTYIALKALALELAPDVEVCEGGEYCFVPSIRALHIGPKPSIISTLHEIGHALYGSSETKACQFSVNLFKAVYPKAYAKLEWHGHMLRKHSRTILPRDPDDDCMRLSEEQANI